MELEKLIAERYSLDVTKRWKIVDRMGSLILLDGFYQGDILDLDENTIKGHHVFYKFPVKEINDQTKLQELSGKRLYTFPDGIVFRVWNYRNEVLCSTKSRIHQPEYLSFNLPEGYYVFSSEGISQTYRKTLSGVFRILDNLELPEVDLAEAIDWLGTDEKTSDGEMIYAVDSNDVVTIYKPLSKKWRETIVYSKAYPDHILFGLEVKEDLLTRWIDLSSSAQLSDEKYDEFWIHLFPDVSTPHKKLINTYAVFLSALYQGPISIYEDWYSVEFPKEYLVVPEPVFSASLNKNGDFSDQLKTANLNRLTGHIWELLRSDINDKTLRKLKRTIDNSLTDPWNAFLGLFRVDGLSGYEINRLRRLL